MSKRSDIKDGISSSGEKSGIIYTRVLGWIDLGHAGGEDCRRLKAILFEEKNRKFFPEFNEWYFPVDYFQDFALNFKINNITRQTAVGINTPLMVRSCLSWEVKKRIALTIMMKTAYRLEALEQSRAFSWYTDSGFSGEDLVSDLVGFYRIFGNGVDPVVLAYPTTKEYALRIWDCYGPIGSYKNKEFRPLLFPQPSPLRKFLPRKGYLPSWLNYIKPLTDLSDNYIYNRINDGPFETLFESRDRMNHELYFSPRNKGWDYTDGLKNNRKPPMINLWPHTPVVPDYFQMRDWKMKHAVFN